MGIPQETPFDATQHKMDRAQYNYWFDKEFGGGDERLDNTKKMLYDAINFELTPVQKQYFTAYYLEGLTMDEIAEMFGVNKSTVSRTISRAKNRLFRYLKYSSPKLLTAVKNGFSIDLVKRQNNRR